MQGRPSDRAAELRKAIAAETARAVAACGEDLLGRAQRLAPIQEGTLRGAGTLKFRVGGAEYQTRQAAEAALLSAISSGQTANITAVVGFELPYAARQHEETGWRHPKGGQAKYLEQPLNANAGRYAGIIAKAQQVAVREAHR